MPLANWATNNALNNNRYRLLFCAIVKLTNGDKLHLMAVNNLLPLPLMGYLGTLTVALTPALSYADTPWYPQQQWACPAGNEIATRGPFTLPVNYANAQITQSGRDASSNSGNTGDINTTRRAGKLTATDWDWVPKSQLAENYPCKTGCDGAYVAPIADWPNANQPPESSPLDAYADSSSTADGITTLAGDVSLTRGNLRVKAEQVNFDQNSQELTAAGNIEVRQPDLLIRASEAFVDTQTSLGEFRSSIFLNHSSGMRGQAKLITQQSDTITTLEQGSITQCTPDDELWYMKASNIRLDQGSGWGTARHARLEIKGVPVFYTPYITFPIDDRRKSGFLFPSFGSSGENGFELSAPYYLNLAPHYDATIAPRYIAERGTMAELELRHLSPFGMSVVSGALLKDDKLYTGQDDNDSTEGNNNPTTPTADLPKQDRWLAGVDHQGQMAGFSTLIDYTKVSDNDYFRDLSIDSLDVKRQTHLNQQATLGYNLPKWRTSITAQQQQTLDDDINNQYKFLPRATVEYTGVSDSFAIQWIALGEFTNFDHDDATTNNTVTFETGKRTYGEVGASFPMQWPAGFIIPTAKVRSVSYDMDIVGANRDTSYSATVPLVTLDTGLIFERDLLIGNSSYAQTLEPRAFYFYSDYQRQDAFPLFDTSQLTFSYSQLFRDTRFSGHDRLDDANQASMGLTTRFVDTDNGRELLSASVGQIFYFQDRQVVANIPFNRDNRVSNSFIATELQYQPTDKLWLTNTLLWDSRQDYVQEGGLSIQYKTDNAAIFNAGYRYRRMGGIDIGYGPRDLDQLDFSIAMPISERWKIYSRFQYDIEGQRSLEDLFAIAYEDCCWKVRLLYQEGIESEQMRMIASNNTDPSRQLVVERDHVFVLEFQLKGLGGIGSKAVGILEESILGYFEGDD